MKFRRILVLIFIFHINAVFGALKTIDKIVALVNNHIILDSDVKNNVYITKNSINPNTDDTIQHVKSYQQILDQLITDELIIQIATQENISTDQNTIDHMIDCIADLCGMTIDQFYIYLCSIGLNEKKYRLQQSHDIIKKIICDNIMYHRANISTHEITKITKEHDIIDFNKQFKLRYITLSLPIQPTHNQINQVEHFAKLLIKEKQHNNNIKKLLYTYSNKNIIQIIKIQETEWISWKDIPIIFDKYLKKTQKGDIIGPILSCNGIHIIEIQDICYKQLIFPITKIKLKIFGIKTDTYENINMIQKLSTIKKCIEKGNTTFDIIIKEKPKNTYFDYYEQGMIWKDLNDFEPSIQKTLLSLKINEISAPIHTSFGYYLIQLIDINISDYIDIIHERAYLFLLNKKFDEIIKNWIQELRFTSYIKIIN